MIILGPDLTQAWVRAGKLAPISSKLSKVFAGKIIGLTLSFPNKSNRPKDKYYRKARSNIKLFLCSIYHSHKHEEQLDFYAELDAFFNTKPRNAETLIGADVDYNLGIRTPIFHGTIGPHGLDNQYQNGKDLLYLLKSNNFKDLLSCFQHKISLHIGCLMHKKLHIY